LEGKPEQLLAKPEQELKLKYADSKWELCLASLEML